MTDRLMTPKHPKWEEFIIRLTGEEGIHTRLKGYLVDWDCDHSQRMVFCRYVLAEFKGIDVEASIKWFINQAWVCDCSVVFLSDGTDIEKRIFKTRQ